MCTCLSCRHVLTRLVKVLWKDWVEPKYTVLEMVEVQPSALLAGKRDDTQLTTEHEGGDASVWLQGVCSVLIVGVVIVLVTKHVHRRSFSRIPESDLEME
jgi:hypothetical protein